MYAETPIEYYQNLAEAVGVAVDLQSEVWSDKTVSAYYQYISDNMSVSNPLSFYQYGQALEDLTGYNVVYSEGGKYYMNSVDDGAGGAFYGIEISPTNIGQLTNTTMRWLRKAAETGPDWPNGTGGGSGGGGGEIGTTIVLENGTGRYPTRNGTSEMNSYAVDYDITMTVPQSVINQFANYDYVLAYAALRPVGNTNINYTLGFFCSNDSISISNGVWDSSSKQQLQNYYKCDLFTVDIDSAQSGFRIYSTSQGYYYTTTVEQIKTQASTLSYSTEYNVNTDSFSIGCVSAVWYKMIKGQEPSKPDDMPPSPTEPRQPIDWPDITLPSLPDFSPTVNFPTTSGDIDWTPVTTRLDAINANLETFYDSFNSYRADLLQFWDALGAALDGFDARLFRLSEQLREVIQWLRNIYDKIGVGVGDAQGDIYEINNYYQPVVDTGNTPAEQLDADVTRLKSKFPFSVPWDLYALLQFLQAPAVAPVFTFTLPYIGTLTCDLSMLDDVAAVCRWASLFAFGAGLVYKTKDILEYVTGMTIGFGGGS